MKKYIALFLVSMFLLFAGACDFSPVELTASDGTAALLPFPNETTAETTQASAETTQAPVETTSGAESDGILTEYRDEFTEFMKYETEDDYFYVSPINHMALKNRPLVIFRVIGVEEAYLDDYTVYRVQIVTCYGYLRFDTEKEYRMAYLGCRDRQLYGRPPLEVGEIYARFCRGYDAFTMELPGIWQPTPLFDAEEADGKWYLYGFGRDMSNVACRIPITDSEENSIYKIGKHDKAIAALEKMGHALPTFGYKVEAQAFYDEIAAFNGWEG